MRLQNKLATSAIAKRGSHPLFIWPVQKARSATSNDVWSITSYVDHNANFPDQLTDYNCGDVTYDTPGGYNHKGIDIINCHFGGN